MCLLIMTHLGEHIGGILSRMQGWDSDTVDASLALIQPVQVAEIGDFGIASPTVRTCVQQLCNKFLVRPQQEQMYLFSGKVTG